MSDYLDTASNYLTSTDGATLLSDLETFAIAQPVAAVAVAAALGFVSARVVKVSNSSGPTT
ncbi:MAG: hypothetical protein IAI50_05985 [Candidatus Eremiobacteraeota bacterium]|nr:hypothetical protein [Candidatus Eremiobacteraeota bacterium]